MPRVAFNENISPSFLDAGRPEPVQPLITEEPEGSLAGAALRQENPVVSAFEFLTAPKFTDDPEFELEPFLTEAVEQNPELQRNLDPFIGVRSKEEFDHIRQKIEQENQDRALLEANGAAGIAASMIAGLLSPTVLLPGGAIVRGATATRTALKTATTVAGWAMVGATIDEGILFSTQETRTGKEVMLGIGSAAVLGGLLGGAAGRLTPPQIRQFEQDMAGVQSTPTIQPLNPQGVADPIDGKALSAQFNPDAASLEEAGGTLNVGVDKASTFLSPVMRNLNQQTSATLRWFQAQLSTGGMFLQGNIKGIPSAVGGEIAELAKQRYTFLADAKTGAEVQWRDYIQATTRGDRLNRKDFDVAVGRALERGGKSDNPFIEKAAQEYREKLFLPIYREAKEAGMPGFDSVSEADATRYLHRVLRQGMVQRDEKEFLEILEEHLTEKLTEKITNKIARQEELFARRQEEIDDLSLDQEGAGQLRSDLEEQIARLPEEFDEEIRDLAQEIRDLRSAAREVPREEAKALRERAKLLEEANKETLTPFRQQESKLKKRFARLDATRSGYERKQQKALEQITRIEDQQLATLDRAMRRAQKLLNKLDETDPKFEQKVAQVREQIERSFRVFAKAETRLDKLKGVPEGFEELVTSDIRPTDKISKLEDRQRIREEALDDLFERLDDLENPENRGQVKELLSEQIENLQKASLSVNNKRALRLNKLRDDVTRFDPQKQKALVDETRANLADKRLQFVEDLQLKDGARITKRTDPSGRGLLADGSRLADNIDLSQTVKEMASDIAARMTGEGDRVPAVAMLGERGPELARTLDIDPTRVWANGRTYEDFLERDVEKVARRYLRTIGPDLELYKRFGTVNPMQPKSGIMQRIKREFNEAKEAVDNDASLSPEQKQKRRQKISNEFQQALRDMEGQIQRLRHTRGVPDNPNSWAWRSGRFALNLNTMRLMGGVVISSLPDLGSIVMRHGLLGAFKNGLIPFVRNLQAMKISAREARIAGVNLDLALHGRAAAMFDIMDEVEHGTKFERGMQWATNNFGRVSGFDYWNHSVKVLAAGLVNARMIDALDKVAKGTAKSRDITYLAANGIDGVTAQKMWKELTETPEGSDIVNGVMMPNTANWQDRDIARAYSAALGRQVDSEVVTPGLERPLWMDANMVGRLVAQFRSFTFSSQQRLVIAAAQEARIGNGIPVAEGVMVQLALGGLAYYLWANARGEETRKEMENASPEKWAVEMVTRSGLLGVLAEVQTAAENVPGTNAIATLGTGRSSRSRFAKPVERAAGPTAGLLFDNLNRIITQGDTGAIRRTLPMQNVTYLAWLFDRVEEQLE